MHADLRTLGGETIRVPREGGAWSLESGTNTLLHESASSAKPLARSPRACVTAALETPSLLASSTLLFAFAGRQHLPQTDRPARRGFTKLRRSRGDESGPRIRRAATLQFPLPTTATRSHIPETPRWRRSVFVFALRSRGDPIDDRVRRRICISGPGRAPALRHDQTRKPPGAGVGGGATTRLLS